MEHQLKTRLSVLSIIVLTLSACTKPEDSAETANQRFSQSIEWNNTHPYRELTIQSDDYLILSMGDSHVGGTENLDSFCDLAKARKATVIVMVGDLTTGQNKDWDIFEQHLPLQDSLPSFLMAGNHDLFFNGWKEFRSRFGSSSYLFTIKTPIATDLFICLETAGGTLGDDQTDWLINILEKMRSGYRHCIVFTHNNFFRTRHTDSTNPLVEELQVLMGLFAKHNVEMVITGHDHKQDVVVFGITTYITMDALKDGFSNAGYFQIRVRNSNIDYVFEKFN
jgi:UDP-2,3-diacylglucosamine pyrophosphatase LpxH